MSTPVMLSQTHMTGQEATLVMVRKRWWKLDPVHCETVSANSLERVGAAHHWALCNAVHLFEVHHHLLQSRLVMVRATRASARNLPQLQMQIETCQPNNCGAVLR